MHIRQRLPRSRRGSLLIVALVLAAIIGLSLGSYLMLSRSALNISNRAMYLNAAMNLAEQGIEEGIYSVNQLVADSAYAWPDWATHNSSHKRRKWTSVGLGPGATGEYRVYVYNYGGTPAPKIVSRAMVTLGSGGNPIEKWIEVQLGRTSKFSNGLVAKNSILFKGNNATVDSWNSDPDGDPSTPPIPFSSAVRNDNGTVGSISIATDAVVVWNADVWGYVSTGGADPAAFVGTNGSILGEDSPTGSNVDPARTSTNFSATFDAVTVPATAAIANLGNINTDGIVLPRPTDLTPNGEGEYEGYYVYDATSVTLNNEKLHITDKVLLRLSSTSTGIAVSGGGGAIIIGADGYLSVYTAGNISLNGQGATNGVDGPDADTTVDEASELGQPIKFQIWGTKTTGTQSIDITGNGLFSGVIYAPQGDVKITGNGAVCGSIVAKDITLSGNAQFHYDESLGNHGGGNPFRISRWKELTTLAERQAYTSVLSW